MANTHPTAIHSQIFTLQQASVLVLLLQVQVVAPQTQTQTQTHLSSSSSSLQLSNGFFACSLAFFFFTKWSSSQAIPFPLPLPFQFLFLHFPNFSPSQHGRFQTLFSNHRLWRFVYPNRQVLHLLLLCLVAVTVIINLFLSNWWNQFNIDWTLIMASVLSQLRGLFFFFFSDWNENNYYKVNWIDRTK